MGRRKGRWSRALRRGSAWMRERGWWTYSLGFWRGDSLDTRPRSVESCSQGFGQGSGDGLGAVSKDISRQRERELTECDFISSFGFFDKSWMKSSTNLPSTIQKVP